jgi:hypothetical protein
MSYDTILTNICRIVQIPHKPTLAPLELPGKLMIRVFFRIPAAGLEIMAIGVTANDLDCMTITNPAVRHQRKFNHGTFVYFCPMSLKLGRSFKLAPRVERHLLAPPSGEKK